MWAVVAALVFCCLQFEAVPLSSHIKEIRQLTQALERSGKAEKHRALHLRASHQYHASLPRIPPHTSPVLPSAPSLLAVHSSSGMKSLSDSLGAVRTSSTSTSTTKTIASAKSGSALTSNAARDAHVHKHKAHTRAHSPEMDDDALSSLQTQGLESVLRQQATALLLQEQDEEDQDRDDDVLNNKQRERTENADTARTEPESGAAVTPDAGDADTERRVLEPKVEPVHEPTKIDSGVSEGQVAGQVAGQSLVSTPVDQSASQSAGRSATQNPSQGDATRTPSRLVKQELKPDPSDLHAQIQVLQHTESRQTAIQGKQQARQQQGAKQADHQVDHQKTKFKATSRKATPTTSSPAAVKLSPAQAIPAGEAAFTGLTQKLHKRVTAGAGAGVGVGVGAGAGAGVDTRAGAASAISARRKQNAASAITAERKHQLQGSHDHTGQRQGQNILIQQTQRKARTQTLSQTQKLTHSQAQAHTQTQGQKRRQSDHIESRDQAHVQAIQLHQLEQFQHLQQQLQKQFQQELRQQQQNFKTQARFQTQLQAEIQANTQTQAELQAEIRAALILPFRQQATPSVWPTQTKQAHAQAEQPVVQAENHSLNHRPTQTSQQTVNSQTSQLQQEPHAVHTPHQQQAPQQSVRAVLPHIDQQALQVAQQVTRIKLPELPQPFPTRFGPPGSQGNQPAHPSYHQTPPARPRQLSQQLQQVLIAKQDQHRNMPFISDSRDVLQHHVFVNPEVQGTDAVLRFSFDPRAENSQGKTRTLTHVPVEPGSQGGVRRKVGGEGNGGIIEAEDTSVHTNILVSSSSLSHAHTNIRSLPHHARTSIPHDTGAQLAPVQVHTPHPATSLSKRHGEADELKQLVRSLDAADVESYIRS